MFQSDLLPHGTVTGMLGSPTDAAWYSFSGRAGDTVFLDHDGAVSGDTLADSNLWLFDEQGHLLAYALMGGGEDDGSDSIGNAVLGDTSCPATGISTWP